MTNAQVSHVYASALLELADERNKRAAVVTSCRDLSVLLTREVVALLDNPLMGKDRAKATLTNLLTGKIEPETLNLMLLLVDRNRLVDAYGIVTEVLYRAAADSGQVEAELTTARLLTPAALDGLSATLKKTLGPGLVLSSAHDTRLIGGMTLRIDDVFVDGSVKRQLQAVKDRMQSIPLSSTLWDE